jgi:very-short-patch-repair endonuclease
VVNALLKKSGWTVLRLWEYEIKKNAQKCAAKVLKALNGKVDL